MFAAGFLLFQAAFIAPLKHDKFVRHYHMIAHPLVLGLANPPNALAEREGISWTDRAGVMIARRIDPDIGDDTMGERYEQALYTYFAKLWIYYPSEMLVIYKTKFVETTTAAYAFLENPRGDMFWNRKNAFWLSAFAWPARPLATWLTAGGAALLFVVAGLLLARKADPRGFIVSAIGAAAAWSFFETAVTLPQVVLWYSPVYVFCVVCFGLLVAELAFSLLRKSSGTARNHHSEKDRVPAQRATL